MLISSIQSKSLLCFLRHRQTPCLMWCSNKRAHSSCWPGDCKKASDPTAAFNHGLRLSVPQIPHARNSASSPSWTYVHTWQLQVAACKSGVEQRRKSLKLVEACKDGGSLSERAYAIEEVEAHKSE